MKHSILQVIAIVALVLAAGTALGDDATRAEVPATTEAATGDASAAEDEQPDERGDGADAAVPNVDVAAGEAQAPRPARSPDIFVPSERISEDHSVAFPVDI
jgi:hypothetical protein